MRDNTFGDRLRALRGGLKKADFARSLGVSAQDYQRYEEGRVPRADTLLEITKRCGVPLEQLIGINPDEQIHPGMAARSAAPPATLAVSTPATAPACRFPADCDLDKRMSAIEIKLDALLGLLGAPLRRETRSRTSKAS